MVKRRGQAAIEMTLALIAGGILFIGILSTWQWLVAAMVSRSRDFDNTRVTAATPEAGKAGSTEGMAPKKFSVWDP